MKMQGMNENMAPNHGLKCSKIRIIFHPINDFKLTKINHFVGCLFD